MSVWTSPFLSVFLINLGLFIIVLILNHFEANKQALVREEIANTIRAIVWMFFVVSLWWVCVYPQYLVK